jgi:hypothetical protein
MFSPPCKEVEVIKNIIGFLSSKDWNGNEVLWIYAWQEGNINIVLACD